MEYLKTRYLELESEVLSILKDKIINSDYQSRFINEKALKINNSAVLCYEEITIINDQIVLIDDDGLYYDLYADYSLIDYINYLIENY